MEIARKSKPAWMLRINGVQERICFAALTLSPVVPANHPRQQVLLKVWETK
jgi:hypothetical protein